MTESRVVIGIDPGTAITGYGLIKESKSGDLTWLAHGVITTESDWDEPRRLLHIYRSLLAIIKESKPDCCVISAALWSQR